MPGLTARRCGANMALGLPQRRRLLSARAVAFCFGGGIIVKPYCNNWRAACRWPALLAACLLVQPAAAEAPVSGLFRWSGDGAQRSGESVPDNGVRGLSGAARPARLPIDPERVAMDFLRARAPALGFGDPEDAVRLRRLDTDQFGATHLRYYRYVEGLRLEDMEVNPVAPVSKTSRKSVAEIAAAGASPLTVEWMNRRRASTSFWHCGGRAPTSGGTVVSTEVFSVMISFLQ